MKKVSLVEEYTNDYVPFYFSTPDYEILAKNISDKIFFFHAKEIPDIISRMRDSLSRKLVFGAIPFDVTESGTLYITDLWEKNDVPFQKRSKISLGVSKNNIVNKKIYEPSPERYIEMVKKAIEDIKANKLDKLVLSRGIEVRYEQEIDVSSILRQLYRHNSGGYTYALRKEDNDVLIGASPEMLVSKRGGSIYSNPLAGSRPRGKTLDEDEFFAQELQNSQKDLSEHKFVVDNIAEKMSEICDNVIFPKVPNLIHTSQLWHLSSVIKGNLKNPDLSVLDAALAIHPTPAICGVPQNEAYRKIIELEGKSRGLFTGIIGWCDENGDGDWAIAIRGAIIKNNIAIVKAGAGIVNGSVPEEELRETEVKFKTVLSVFDL